MTTEQLDIFGQATIAPAAPAAPVQLAFAIVEAVDVAARRRPKVAAPVNFDEQIGLAVDVVRTAAPRPMPRRRRR